MEECIYKTGFEWEREKRSFKWIVFGAAISVLVGVIIYYTCNEDIQIIYFGFVGSILFALAVVFPIVYLLGRLIKFYDDRVVLTRNISRTPTIIFYNDIKQAKLVFPKKAVTTVGLQLITRAGKKRNVTIQHSDVKVITDLLTEKGVEVENPKRKFRSKR